MNFHAIDTLLENLIQSQTVPGCALSIRHKGNEIYLKAVGEAEQRPNPRLATTDTIWDLASITKVLCTAHIFLKLTNDGYLDPDDAISDLLPEVPSSIRISDCLQHSAGYEAWRPFYAKYITKQAHWGSNPIREDMLKMVLKSQPKHPPQSQYTYSDIGFLILCAYLEKKFSKPIHTIWHDVLPIEARRGLYWGHPQAAATEDCPIRRHVIVGEVHDLNAAVMGGKATHAGLFGTVSALTKTAEWPLLGYHDVSADLKQSIVKRFWTSKGVGSHCLGWDTPSPSGSSASSDWPNNGVGHLGFTGTSIWIAPDLDLVVGFVSNRVHPKIEGGAIPLKIIPTPKYDAFKKFRPLLHSTIIKEITASA